MSTGLTPLTDAQLRAAALVVAEALAVTTGTVTTVGATVVHEVPGGHSSSTITLGAATAASQVVFEQSDDGVTWAATNMRRNNTADVNDSYSEIDNNPVGTGNAQIWKGTVGGIRYVRVRALAVAGGSVAVRITTSPGVGGTFILGNPPSVSDYFTDALLDSAGDVCEVRTSGMGAWAVYGLGQWAGTLHLEGSVDGVNYRPLLAAVQGVGSLVSTVAGLGTGGQQVTARGAAGALRSIRVRAGSDFSGSVQTEARAGAGTSGVFMVAPVPVAGLSAGAQTGRRTVGTSVSQIDAQPLAVRTSVEVQYVATGASNNGKVYVGFMNTVTASTGRELSPGESWTLDLTAATPLWAIASAAGQQVQVTEVG